MRTPIRALTVRQPWAYATAHLDKRIENRTWRTGYRGLVLIHAAAGLDRPDLDDIEAITGQRPDEQLLVRSAVVAIARLVSCTRGQHASRWAAQGQWHWEWSGVMALAEPVPAKGALGLWRPDEDLVLAVREQLIPVVFDSKGA